MTKQEALENYIARHFGEVQTLRLRDLIDAALEEADERGFNQAVREIAEGSFEHPQVKELRERFNYLKLGGSWLKYGTTDADLYLAGFEDAMKTLGVKP